VLRRSGRSVCRPRNAHQNDALADDSRPRTCRTARAVQLRPHRGASQLSRRVPRGLPVHHDEVQLRHLTQSARAVAGKRS